MIDDHATSSSLFRFACQVVSLRARVLSLTVPQVQEKQANGAPLRHLLPHARGDRVAQDDSQREIRLRELHHCETGEGEEGPRFEEEGAVVGISVEVVGSGWV